MQLLDLALDTPALNLALDEALLEQAERGEGPDEILRLWESTTPFVALGRSSRLSEEVDPSACRRLGIPILRRISGGGTVLAGPGCLMYSVVLSYQRRPQLRPVDHAHRHVLNSILAALHPLVPTAQFQGTSDLALVDPAHDNILLKFSGNSLRCRRHHFLYHGTLLYRFPLELVSTCLLPPPRQPTYRVGRSHQDFLANLPLTAKQLRAVLANAFNVHYPLTQWPRDLVQELFALRYSRDDWNLRR